MLPYITPVTEKRAAYNEVVRLYEQALKKSATQIAILPSELRSEVVVTQTNTIEWLIRSDQANQGANAILATENRLDINDAFMADSMSIQFGVRTTADPVGTVRLHTFDNARVFTAAASNNAVKAAYNGQLDLEVNTVKFMDSMGASAFRYVDTAQQGQDVFTAPGGTTDSSADNALRPFVGLVPQVHMSGADKVKFTLRLPNTVDFTLAENTITAVLILRGLRIQNGGTFRAI